MGGYWRTARAFINAAHFFARAPLPGRPTARSQAHHIKVARLELISKGAGLELI